MRALFGMILGCLLTILVVYLHDSGANANSAGGPAAGNRMIVNWDVAAGEWARMEQNVRVAWDKLTSSVEKART